MTDMEWCREIEGLNLEGGNYSGLVRRTWSLRVGERDIYIHWGDIATQAKSALLIGSGDTVLLVAVTCSDNPRPDIDFMPLTVDYEEKMYAIGRIPGGFIKKEGRPPDHVILKARLVDRAIRPMFPEGFFNDVNVYIQVISADPDIPADVLALTGASTALSISPIPFDGPIGAVRVSLLDDQFIVNPTNSQLENSKLDLVVACSRDRVVMIEAGAKEVDEETMMSAIKFGFEACQPIIELQEKLIEEIGQPKIAYNPPQIPENLRLWFELCFEDTLRAVTETLEKAKRNELLEQVTPEKLLEFMRREGASETEIQEVETYLQENPVSFTILRKRTLKALLRDMVLNKGMRPDGRRADQIRPISIEVGVLPRPHGSALFRRGQTQVLSTVTLGTMREQQMIEGLTDEDEFKRYMHHYYFPPYSVGEARPLRAQSRREIGHGALAERAIIPVLPSEDEFPYTIRVVSDVLESNGSTSMASTCGSSLALMDAGVPIRKHVAGIAIGLLTDPEDINRYKILTDIQGLEDFFGEMDFKVAGTYEGITAIQMDTKLKGITFDIVRDALNAARIARLYILTKMYEAIPKPREELSEYAPRVVSLKIEPSKIADIIGSGGRVIRKIIDETDSQIDIKEDGSVFIYASSLASAEKAKEIIEKITNIKAGNVYLGKVVRLADFGAFIEVAPGKIGLLHISQVSSGFVRDIREYLNVGDEVLVKVQEVDDTGRIILTRKDLEGAETRSADTTSRRRLSHSTVSPSRLPARGSISRGGAISGGPTGTGRAQFRRQEGRAPNVRPSNFRQSVSERRQPRQRIPRAELGDRFDPQAKRMTHFRGTN